AEEVSAVRRWRASKTVVELAERRDHALEVRLLWDPGAGGRVWVDVVNKLSGSRFSIHADPERALDVYYHPFAYFLPAGAQPRRVLRLQSRLTLGPPSPKCWP